MPAAPPPLEPRGFGAATRRRLLAGGHYPRWVLLTVLSGMFGVGFTITVLAVSLKTIATDLDSSVSTVTWVITGPMLAFGVLGPAAGKAGDLFGHKRLYVGGMVLVCVFAGLTSLSANAGQLVLFRVLGAASGAAAGPAAMAMINRLNAREERVRAMGWFSFVAAGAPVLGVVAGGPVVEHLSWRLLFAAQVPILGLVALAALVVLPDLDRRSDVRFDLAGATTLAAGVTAIMVAINRAGEWGFSHPVVVGGLVLGPPTLLAFFRIEMRAADPMIPVHYMRSRNFAVPALVQLCINFAYMGGFIITPLLLQEVFGYGETRVGLISIARPITFAIAGPLAGFIATRVGERASGITGACAVTVSMLMLASLGGASPDLLVILSLSLSGIGLGASSPAMNATVANAVDERDLGVAGASLQLMSQVGTVAGITIMQALQTARVDASGLTGSFEDAYLLGALVGAFAVVGSFFVRSTDRSGRVHDIESGIAAATTSGESARVPLGTGESATR